jgi:hypothetical protein
MVRAQLVVKTHSLYFFVSFLFFLTKQAMFILFADNLLLLVKRFPYRFFIKGVNHNRSVAALITPIGNSESQVSERTRFGLAPPGENSTQIIDLDLALAFHDPLINNQV